MTGESGVPTGPVEPGDFRVSDVDRARAAALLEDAVGQGMITLAEFEERAGAAMAARVRRELDAVLADLPVGEVAAEEPPLELSAGMGDLKRTGRWVVPRRIFARCSMGSVKLDFTEADCRHREVELEVQCGWGSVTVIVPKGWTVLTGAIAVGSGDFVHKATAPGVPGKPVLRVSGKVTAGTIKLKHSRR
ncbi:DUF1707 SHOCT-like domain-containing protein [Amycolatopsis sp. CA-230715]|uniref:DUF1707 SHOCT-like domain-containing protein n=1 Tax=Amycolatopsis sp. CA-230715 TaxID=2745196 RepID=UPI001C013AC9|nr:DUF1707 domain-containing protein [Amycolatopsis sp. CA-230715]QWF79539.1 hypothetical protein HUW46_02947 [Amycolatopsis sp. CA-230715]